MHFLTLCAVLLSFYAAQGQELRGSVAAITNMQDNTIASENSVAPETISRQLKINVADESAAENVDFEEIEIVGEENLEKLQIVPDAKSKTAASSTKVVNRVRCVSSKSSARDLLLEYVSEARKAKSRTAFLKIVSNYLIQGSKLFAANKIRLSEAEALNKVFTAQFNFKDVPDKADIEERIRSSLEGYYAVEGAKGDLRAKKDKKDVAALKAQLNELKVCEKKNLEDLKSEVKESKSSDSKKSKKSESSSKPSAKDKKRSSEKSSDSKKRRLSVAVDEDLDMSNLAEGSSSSTPTVTCRASKSYADDIASQFSERIREAFKKSNKANTKKQKVIAFADVKTIATIYSDKRKVAFAEKRIREQEFSVLGVFLDTITETKVANGSPYITESDFGTAFNDALKLSKQREKQLAVETVKKISNQLDDYEDKSEVADICKTKRLYPSSEDK